jgi:Predicted enzyme related to lactoylglutathione lyase
MKKSLLLLIIVASFFLGFAFKGIQVIQNKQPINMKRVTGIGGIFFKCKDPEKMKQWYKAHLGIDAGQYGAKFNWQQDTGTRKGYTLWSLFSDKTKYFEPSSKGFMINYRVENLEALVSVLEKEGVVLLDKIDISEYGKFVHLLDPEGNKIELWEPGDK